MIYLTSDLHLKKGDTKQLKCLKVLKEEDLLIVLGDMANDWMQEEDQFWFMDEIDQCLGQILLVDGNHEDFNKLAAYPEKSWHGIGVHQLGARFYHALRGQVLRWDGYSFWLMGGGYSGPGYIKRHADIWQKEENPSKDEMERGLRALEAVNWQVDYMLTHTAPLAVIKDYALSEDFNEFNVYLDQVVEKTKFKQWFFGHFHQNKQYGKQYEMIYQELRQIK